MYTPNKQSSHCKKWSFLKMADLPVMQDQVTRQDLWSPFFFERTSLSYRKGWFPIERGWFDCHEDQITRHRCDHFSSLKGRVGLLQKGRVSHRKGWFDCHWDQVTRTEVFVKTPVSIVGKTSKTSLSMSVTVPQTNTLNATDKVFQPKAKYSNITQQCMCTV